MVEALCFEKGFPVLQVIERGKLVAGEVDDAGVHGEFSQGEKVGGKGELTFAEKFESTPEAAEVDRLLEF